MSSLIDILQSFFDWLYTSAQSVVEFINNMSSWLVGTWARIQAVSNLVMPPALQALLAFMIAFLLIMLVVKVVVNLL